MVVLIKAYFAFLCFVKFPRSFPAGTFPVIVLLVLWRSGVVSAQTPSSVMGYSGLVVTPTARILEDGQLSANVSRIPKLYADNYKPYVRTCYVAAMGFMPFMEATMGFIRPDNFQGGVGDRTVSVRLRLLREQRRAPAITIGFHDFFAVEEFDLEPADAQHFTSSYIVMTKNIHMFQSATIGFTIGYGSNWLPSSDNQLNGMFGGVEFSPFDRFQLLLEHDSIHTNAGMRFNFFNRVFYMLSFWQLKYMMHQLSFNISLS